MWANIFLGKYFFLAIFILPVFFAVGMLRDSQGEKKLRTKKAFRQLLLSVLIVSLIVSSYCQFLFKEFKEDVSIPLRLGIRGGGQIPMSWTHGHCDL